MTILSASALQDCLRRRTMKPFARLLALGVVLLIPLSAAFAGDPSITVLVAYHSRTGHTEKMAEAAAEGARSVPGARVVIKRVGQVTQDELFGADGLIVGSPVYWSNMAAEVKSFFDDWQFKFGVFPDFKMRGKVGGAFTTGGQVSSGKEVTLLTILAAMLGNQMIVVGGGGAFGASATTEGNSPGVDEQELRSARELGHRVAEVARVMKAGRAHTSP